MGTIINSWINDIVAISKWRAVVNTDKKTPAYRLIEYSGNSPIFEQRATKGELKGEVILYLIDRPDNFSRNAPELRLQGKDNLNITGLYQSPSKECAISLKQLCRLSTAYGWAEGSEYTSAKRNGRYLYNYMYPHKGDAYIFRFSKQLVLHPGSNQLIPEEMIFYIIDGKRYLAGQTCRLLDNVPELFTFKEDEPE